jgi:hypothetical protein
MKTKLEIPRAAESAHTPGPWTVASVENTLRGRVYFVRAIREGKPVVVADCGLTAESPPTRAECEANARLIAAAPELLAALKTLIRAVADAGKEGTAGDLGRAESQARAALAKAEGTQ